MTAILEFGCGCGRVLRNWHGLTTTRLCGTDYNPKLVSWCSTNLDFAQIGRNGLEPPLGYRDAEFDLVYAISVFTHLTHELQLPWIGELSRVLKPGGYLIITTSGERYLPRLSHREREQFAAGHLVVKDDVRAPGSNRCAAYHPLAYVRDRFGEHLSIAEFIPGGARGAPPQDFFVLSKPPSADLGRTLVDRIPEGATGNPHQDIVLFRK